MAHRRDSSSSSESSDSADIVRRNSSDSIIRDSESVHDKKEERSFKELILNPDVLENQDLICQVCYDLCVDPQIVIDKIACEVHSIEGYDSSCQKCRPCGHTFCVNCISELKQYSRRRCPLCRHQWNDMECILDIALADIINNLDIKCKNAGCQWTGQMKMYEMHDRECEYGMYTCRWCLNLVIRAQRTEHIDVCPDVFVRCECQEQVIRGNLEKHKTQLCKLRLVPCRWCQVGVPCSDVANHENECHQKLIKCRHAPCEMELKKDDPHESMCEYRPMNCAQCNHQFPMKLLETHECPEAIVSCPEEKCDSKILRKDLDDHRKTCKYTIIPCTIQGCPWQGQRMHLLKHLNEDFGIHLSCLTQIVQEKQNQELTGKGYTYGTVAVETGKHVAIVPVRVYPNDAETVLIVPLMMNCAPIKVPKNHVMYEWDPRIGDDPISPYDSALWSNLKNLDCLYEYLQLENFNSIKFIPNHKISPRSIELQVHNILRPASFYRSSNWKQKLTMNDVVDVKDRNGNWYMAEISAVRGSKYEVHFFGFNGASDEIVSADQIDRPWSQSNGKNGSKLPMKGRNTEFPIMNIK